MNILIPHNWLLEHLETDANPQTIQRLVSLSGPSIERIYDREGESVYDIEVTTNRVDSMSVRGIAREAAVILQQAGVEAKLKPLSLPQPIVEQTRLPLPKITNDERFCKRILCVILQDVQHTPTPDWMAKRLRQIEQNVHDSVIDITNYVTHELGHPCHAFDYDKMMALGGEIIVKEAAAGKKFITLDKMTYETKGGEIVFENAAGDIIDLPAIKGTANSAVDGNTNNVLLWIESLDAKKVRTASMSHAIRTVAAQLNEKNVDPYLAEPTMLLGIQLYRQLCSAKVASELYDAFPQPPKSSTVKVSLAKIETYLGISLPAEQIVAILTALECQTSIDDGQVAVTPPSFRSDLQIGVDIIEEIARIYGYHNLPSTLMQSAIPTNRQPGTNFILEERMKRFLGAHGAQELYTYSMVSETLALQDSFSLEDHVRLSNPLTDDRIYLRRSLIPSLRQAVAEAAKPNLVVFELANVYHPRPKDLPTEELHLTILSAGDYRQLRATTESMLATLHISNLTIETESPGSQNAQLTITKTDGEKCILGNVTTNGKHIAFDFLWSKILEVASTHPNYTPLPKAAPLTEDLTFTLPANTTIGPLITGMKSVSPIIHSIALGDQFKQNYTFHFTYLDVENSMSSELVAPVRAKIVEVAEQIAKAALVGSLQ